MVKYHDQKHLVEGKVDFHLQIQRESSWWLVGSRMSEQEADQINVQCQMQSRESRQTGSGGRCELSKPIPSAGLPPEGLRLLKVKKTSPKQSQLGIKGHIYKPMGDMFFWSYQNIPCYIWNIVMQNFIVYLKFKCNWTSCVLSGNPTGMLSSAEQKINHLDTRMVSVWQS